MKTELLIKKNNKDSYEVYRGSSYYKSECNKISAFQVYSWIAYEASRVMPVSSKGKGKYKITIEKIE